jgi:hypothetical protein
VSNPAWQYAYRRELAAYDRASERLAQASISELKMLLVPAIKATPEGFRCAIGMLQRLPRHRHGAMLQAMRGLEVAPWCFQLSLTLAWRAGGGCRVVAHAAGTRENLVEWFKYARFDWPADAMLAEVITSYVPKETILYRGGRGDPARLAQEYSWTPLKPIAALFGCANPDPHPDNDGKPVIVRRIVPRAHVAVAWVVHNQEHVVLEPGPYEVETVDLDELAELLVQGRKLNAQHLAQQSEFVSRWEKFLSGLPRG